MATDGWTTWPGWPANSPDGIKVHMLAGDKRAWYETLKTLDLHMPTMGPRDTNIFGGDWNASVGEIGVPDVGNQRAPDVRAITTRHQLRVVCGPTAKRCENGE